MRSIPLFYGQKANNFYISDSADWIREQVGNHEIDAIAREEFKLTGYITGPDTLFPDVKQIQPGQAIIVEDGELGVSIKPVNYYWFMHEEADDAKSLDDLSEEHDRVLVGAFHRLIQVANGRTLVVPLSGGYDSRAIVLMLKRLGYKNVITFSYGKPGNQESEISRNIAESLGFRWEFVTYSYEDWYKWFNSEEKKNFVRYASGLSSLEHIQDWPAVWRLREENLIPADSIFIPGHTAMLSLGGKPGQTKLVEDCVIAKHYSLNPMTSSIRCLINQRVKNYINWLLNNDEKMDADHCFYMWACMERKAKFIVNSIRVYEFWGYDWWLPLYDQEFMDYCLKLPIKHMAGKTLFKSAIDKMYITSSSYVISTGNKPKKALKQILQRIKLEAFARKIYYRWFKSMEKEYNKHPLMWYGLVDKADYKRFYYYNGNEIINSILVRIYLDDLK